MNAWADLVAIMGISLIPLAYYCVVYNPWAQKYWQGFRTKEEYLQWHPELLQGQKVLCFQCASTEQLDLGLLRPTDYRRRIVCARCKTLLWRESICSGQVFSDTKIGFFAAISCS